MQILLIIFLIILKIVFKYRDKGVPMFLYHQVNPISNVTKELFEEHLKILKEKEMETITITEYGEGNFGKNPFLISLDDGYYDNYKVVFPLLKKYNMKATVFLNTLYIKDKREEDVEFLDGGEANYQAMKNYLLNGDGTTSQYMSWEEIKIMHDSGLVDFQPHSHKHTAVFMSDKLEDIFIEDERDITDVYLYGEIKEGYPKFPKRGEYASKAVIIDKEFFELFKNYYDQELKGKSKKEILKLGQKFVDENKRYFHYEDDEEFKKRVLDDFHENRRIMEEKLGYKMEYFCWPWGHRNKTIIELLEKEGIKGFVTTKKGTNSRKINYHMIKRVELRNYTPKKFKINLFITRNYILGKIYGWLS